MAVQYCCESEVGLPSDTCTCKQGIPIDRTSAVVGNEIRDLKADAWLLNATETGKKHWPSGRLGWNVHVDFGFCLLNKSSAS